MRVQFVAGHCVVDRVPNLQTTLVASTEEVSLVHGGQSAQGLVSSLPELVQEREVVGDVPKADTAVTGSRQEMLPMLGQASDRPSMEGVDS
jgi:hypothetical protein